MQPNSKLPNNELFISALGSRPKPPNSSQDTNSQDTHRLEKEIAKWQWNVHTDHFAYNTSWARIHNTEVGAISSMRKGFNQLIHPEDFMVRQELLSMHVKGSLNQYSFEFRIKGTDDTWIWVHEEANSIQKNDHGQALYISGNTKDVTEIKQVELEVRKNHQNPDLLIKENTVALQKSMELLKKEVVLRRKAEQRISNALKEEKETTELRSRIISCISHEFKTPLTTILSSTQLMDMINEMTPNPRLTKHLNQIESSVLHMNSMISDISFMEKMGIGQIIVNKVQITLPSFVDDIIREVGTKHELPEFKISYHRKAKTIISDRKLLRQILRNLISNSVKYSKEGSSIDISFTKEDESFSLSISDQGVGIPKEEQTHIFEYFFRADNIGTIEGTGVGLAIVKSATQMLKGAVNFQSKKNEGTTFTITLPV